MRTRLLDQPTCFSRWLPAGDHYLELQTDQYSSNSWQVRLELLDPWSNCGDPVPAQTRYQARLLPEDGQLSTGMGTGHAGSGYFRLPVAEGDREIRLGGRLGRVEVELVNEDGATLTIEDADERNVHVATIPAGQTRHLDLTWTLPPGLGEETPVHLHVLIGETAASQMLSVEAGADALSPLVVHDIPVHLQGLTNLAWKALGAEFAEVEIALGDSVTDLVAVGRFELEAHDRLQVLELDQPTSARFVRIRPLAQWDPDARGRTGTGLFMALGEPGGEMAGRHHNLLDGELGGHWVYTLPDASRTQEFPHSRRGRV